MLENLFLNHKMETFINYEENLIMVSEESDRRNGSYLKLYYNPIA